MTTKTKKRAGDPEGDTRQPELDNMPEKTEATLRAEEVAQVLEEIDVKKEALKLRQQNLVIQMKQEEIMQVACLSASGTMYVFTRDEIEKLVVTRK